MGSTSRGSNLQAGSNVKLIATGAGKDSNILVQGSDITAGKDVTLIADNQVNLLASQDTSSDRSTNSSSSAAVGVAVTVGQGGASFGITASASQGKGHANSDDVAYSNTHVNAGNTVTIQSGGDTTLKGAVVSGKQVVADVGGNLNLQSLQDTSTFSGKQQNIGGSVTVGAGFSGSVSYSKSKVNSDYLSVVEQSGIKAGDGGFNVQVKGDTSLKGAVIASNQVAVEQGKNHFSTEGELTTSDLQNSAKYEGKAIGVNASMGKDSGKFGVSGMGAGGGQDSGSASSTTTAGISGMAGDTAVRSTDAETGIQRIFDKEKVQKEIDAQVAITAEFGKLAAKSWGEYANNRFVNAENEEEVRCWGPDGVCRAGGHALLGGLAGGVAGAAGAGLTSVAAPHVAGYLVGQGVEPSTAAALTGLLALGAGNAAGGTAAGAGALNEAAQNTLAVITAVNATVQQGQRFGAGGLMLLDQAGQALLRTCASSSVCMNLLPAAAAAWLAAQLTQEFEAKQPSLADQIPGYGGGYGPKPGPSHTGNDKPANPTPGGSSTEYPAEGPKESGVVGGKPLDPQTPEGSILPGKPADPLPGIGPVFSDDANSPKGGKPIEFDGQFYSVDGLKFSKSYYERLWQQGRPAPFVQAKEVLASNPKITPDPRGAEGYFRYEGAGLEMIYNPSTGQIGHIQPIRSK
ncbi:hemagglutinin repeat-containing protein [Comamonas sp. CMM02]|uniref:hemagglutinin repeat-containing protein n=1 Tax=Comamonas sp. CMM02 TaxID=2769307 RepID=UPI001781DF4D|nr:hemagglutinin repeat-containing protein [Comamonas sp. CMM02]MBD9402830.1 hemagglutinin repeat-containing protein [Comamonas sp. CMM02]